MEEEITLTEALKNLRDSIRLLIIELLINAILFLAPRDRVEGHILILWIEVLGKMQGLDKREKEIKNA